MRTTRTPRPQIVHTTPLTIPPDMTREEVLVLVAVHNISMRTHGHNEGPVHTSTICDECQQEFSFTAYHALTRLREVSKLLHFNPKTPLDDNQFLAPAVADNMDMIAQHAEKLNAAAGKPAPEIVGINDTDPDADEADEGTDPASANDPASAGRSQAPDAAAEKGARTRGRGAK